MSVFDQGDFAVNGQPQVLVVDADIAVASDLAKHRKFAFFGNVMLANKALNEC